MILCYFTGTLSLEPRAPSGVLLYCHCCCCSSEGNSGPFLAVSYAGFAPLLVEGLKELDGIMSGHQREAEARLQVNRARTCL